MQYIERASALESKHTERDICCHFQVLRENEIEIENEIETVTVHTERDKYFSADIKMGSCVFQCDVPHQWIAQLQAVSVYCDGVGWGVILYGSTFASTFLWIFLGQTSTKFDKFKVLS